MSSAHRPVYGRGAGSVGRAFDARQKIGSGDVRQRLGVGGATGGKRPEIDSCYSLTVNPNAQNNQLV